MMARPKSPPTAMIRVDARFAAHLAALADRYGVSVTDLTRMMLAEWHRREKEKEWTPESET